MKSFIVEEREELFTYLKKKITSKSKNNIKSLLKNGYVWVNGKVITKYNYLLDKGDKIVIGKDNNTFELKIIYEDNDIIVIDKPTKILSISNYKEREETLYRKVSDYLKKEGNKVFVIHRLDYDTSGVIMFAKNMKIQKLYQDNWNTLAKEREYTAIVEGNINDKGHIESYLKETKTLLVYSSKDKNGSFAITDYVKIKSNNKYSLIKVYILTGRRNQIRCHLSDIGHPIVGDSRYKAKSNPINRLALHASTLKIINPLTNELMIFKSEVPKSFLEIIK